MERLTARSYTTIRMALVDRAIECARQYNLDAVLFPQDPGLYWLDQLVQCKLVYDEIDPCNWDPTPMDEAGMDDDDWNNGQVYHEPLSFYLDS